MSWLLEATALERLQLVQRLSWSQNTWNKARAHEGSSQYTTFLIEHTRIANFSFSLANSYIFFSGIFPFSLVL